MRITKAQGYAEPRDGISHDWVARLGAWNMTPLFIPNGRDVHSVAVDGGWLEIDTVRDYEQAAAFFADGGRHNFFDPLATPS